MPPHKTHRRSGRKICRHSRQIQHRRGSLRHIPTTPRTGNAVRGKVQLPHSSQHHQSQRRNLRIRVESRTHLRRRRRNQRKEAGTRRMLPKTTHPRTVLHHRMNQKPHKEQPHHSVKSQDTLPHPIRCHSLRRTGTPGSTQSTGAQRHRKIIDRHAETATGALLVLKGRRH